MPLVVIAETNNGAPTMTDTAATSGLTPYISIDGTRAALAF